MKKRKNNKAKFKLGDGGRKTGKHVERARAASFSVLLQTNVWRGKLLRTATERKGAMNFEEFVTFCYEVRETAQRRIMLRKIYDFIDYDGKGRIKVESLIKGLGSDEVMDIVNDELKEEMKAEFERKRIAKGIPTKRKKKKKKNITETKESKDQAPETKKEEEEEEEERELSIPTAPLHHPLRALLSKQYYEVPLATAVPYMKNEEGLDFEDFLCSICPIMDTVKERLCVMRSLHVLDVAYMDDENVVYDKNVFVSIKNSKLLGEMQRQLKLLDDVPQNSVDKLLKKDWSISYIQNNKKRLHNGSGCRPLLDDDLCLIALKNLHVKHVNSRKREKYATLEELVNFLMKMRKEHRDRDAARDLYEAIRFAKGMPLEDLQAPAPSPMEYAALLDDAGKEFISDEGRRRCHRRPSRPVDALMVLMHHRSEFLDQNIPGSKSREKKEKKHLGSRKASDSSSESSSDDENDESSEIVVHNEHNAQRAQPRPTTEDVASAHGLQALTISEKEKAFFEQRRIAAADVVARMDHMRILQRPKLFMEMLQNVKPTSFEEFYLFAIEAQRTMKTRSVLRRIFDLIDTDESNDLSKQELLFAFTRSREVRKTVHQLEGLKTMQDPHLFEEAFDAIDTNNDQSASFEELVQFALLSGNDGSAVIDDDDDEWEVPDDEEVLKVNGETVDDKWDALRRKEGALPDHDPIYLPDKYSNDDMNETNNFIYEELHDLYEIFDKMWEGVSSKKPKDPYEHIIQILRGEQASRRLRLGIDLSLTDINEHLPRDLRKKLFMCCKRDDTRELGKLLEVHQLSLDHRCFYVDRSAEAARGDGVKGYGWQLEPEYHRGYDSTLLHASSWFGSDKVLTWLLERGADAFVIDVIGRTARDVAGSDPIRLLLHTRTLGRVWKDTHNPFERDIRMATFSRWRKRKERSNAKVWEPRSSHRKSALEKRLLQYRVEEPRSTVIEDDLKSQAKIRGQGGTHRGHAVKEVDDTDIIGKPGDFIDQNLVASRLLPYPNNLTYVEHSHDGHGSGSSIIEGKINKK